MISIKHATAILLGIFLCSHSISQTDSCNLKISLLTCGPGEELYSIFGHSAIRVQDDAAYTDIIFNYGTFDFEDPDFYTKFVKGKLLYFVSIEQTKNFKSEYQLENRSIIEQQLKLTCEEKVKLYDALRVNAREENKYYKYEFLFDNCSTRLRDMVVINTGQKVSFKRILPDPPPTFRNMIHEYLDRGNELWSEFGIDLSLGSRIDRKVKNEEAMFLPDYLMKGFDSAISKGTPIVQDKKIILRSSPVLYETKSWFTPLAAGILLLIAGLIFTFTQKIWAERAGNIFDISFFMILGIMGSYLLFMWLGTEHELCRDNFNLLWAIPTHLVMCFFVLKKTSFTRKYFAATAVICLLLIITWPFIPQGMNYAFLPLIMVAGLRSGYRSMKK